MSAGPASFRLEGWESRLVAVIEAARARSYALGEYDCFRLACAAVAALTGVDLWPAWAGRYRTRREALRLLVEFAGPGHSAAAMPLFSAAFTRLFCAARESPRRARRGDILEYVDSASGEQHLGVCVGACAAVPGEHGLLFVPLSQCAGVWRIG